MILAKSVPEFDFGQSQGLILVKSGCDFGQSQGLILVNSRLNLSKVKADFEFKIAETDCL